MSAHFQQNPLINKNSFLSLFFGGLVPLIAFMVIEDSYGPMWGTLAGLFFGVSEITYEWFRYKKILQITLIGNLMLFILGGLSLLLNDGIWFKLQPAFFEAFFAAFLWGSLILKKNLLVFLMEKQGLVINEFLKETLNQFCLRLGLFFALHAALASWAAFFWTTSQWILLKGLGLTLSFFLYLALEFFFLKIKVNKKNN